MKKKINKARLFRNAVLVILLLGCVGFYLSNRYVKTKGFDNIGDFVSTWRANKKLADGANPKVVQLILSDKDYDFLKNKRQKALDRGIQVNKGDNYVDCKVVCDGDTTKADIRLKGHMTDHLEGDKWSFRVKTKDEVMGMYRFSLQNPATRNYAYEWVYHQLLGYEGVIHLKYDFVRLKLNDKDLGIYAVEEHFGQHILRDNERPPGAIIRWNPELYWEHRLDELDGLYLDEAYSHYESSFPEAYDRGVVKDDPELMATYQSATLLLEQFRRGIKTTSEVFDLDKMAKFHAVIDLVGGYHSLDWSDVKFYYNGETKKIEPVGYESFSVRPTTKIAGQRTPDDYASVGFNYHDRLFADPEFFTVYIQELQRICDEAYFKAFTEEIKEELNQKRGILAHEFAYIKFSYQGYYDNIEAIRHNINLPKPFHAFLKSSSDSTVTVSVTPVSDYPIKIWQLSVNDKREYQLDSTFTLPPKTRNTYAHYWDLTFRHEGKKLKNLKLKAAIPGGQTTFEIEVSDLPMATKYDSIEIDAGDEQQDSILVWVNDSVAFFKDRNARLTGLVEIPENKTLVINAGQSLDFQAKGRLVINGNLRCVGSTENEVRIMASDLKQDRPCITLLNGSFTAVHTQFSDLQNDLIEIHQGNLNLQKCIIADSDGKLITATSATVTLIDCAAGNMASLGSFDRCLVRLKSFAAANGKTLLTSSGSDIEMHQAKIMGYEVVADLDYFSDFSSWGSVFEGNSMLAGLNHVSSFNTYASTVHSGDVGVQIRDIVRENMPESTYLFYKTPVDELKNEVLYINK